MFDDELFDLFREESREHLAALESSLLDLESAENVQSCRGIVDGIFRRAHSFKGSSRAIGLTDLQNLAQKLEDTLDAFRDDPESIDKESIDRALAEFDALRTAYEHWESGGSPTAREQPSGPVQDDAGVPPATQTATAPAPSSESASVLDDSILSIFREEVQEHLASLEASLLDLETLDETQTRRAVVDDLFRRAHSLKGSARAIGQEALQNLAQQLENTLDRCREDPRNIDKPLIDKALAEFDALRAAYLTWDGDQASGGAAAVAHNTPLPETSEEAQPAPKPSRARTATEDRFVVRVPAERLDRMLSMAGELQVTQRGGDSLTAQLNVLGEVLTSALSGCKRYSEKLARANPLPDARALKTANDELRDHLDGAVERLRQLQSEFGKKRFREELMLEALEQDIRTARLVPLASLTDPLRRAVRDLVQSLDKSIRYLPDVGDILLDKAVMESLKDPLMHLIRNAADHGIESPQQRLAAGKPEEGTIKIAASRRAESVLIRVGDDGGGIKFDRIRQKLKQAGMDEGEIAALSEKELARYLFQAGFTTRQKATEVSGRGVGMDVVLDAIHRLQGTVELEHSSPAGTTFLITVPVTISTARILTVTSGGQRYGIPTNAMVRTGRIETDSLRELEGNMILTVDGAPVRWIDLSQLLGLPAPAAPGGELRSYLLLLHEGRTLALAVDDFEDESEVILKSLEFPLGELDEVIGGTIRPDGSVQLVLDPAWIASRALRVERQIVPMQAEPSSRILVADDSPTTRSIIRNLLSASGYLVQTAVDGVDALQRLKTQPFDLVVTDVEMPRVNGFELTRQIKSQMGLPVILVTGLAKEDDRRRGLDAGADAYVVKSTFDDQGLLEIVKQFL